MIEPVALICGFCEALSKYKIEYNHKLPRGWRDYLGKYCCPVCCKKKGVK